jgi:cellulose synthase/poly-beta-1,6-N-acetylglucosamine synthase-like glycosyltransferase
MNWMAAVELVGSILLGVAAGVILYAYAGYPLVLLFASPFRKTPACDSDYIPSLTVLITAYNESRNIETKVRETLALDYPPGQLEVIVASDGSTDGTDEIVRSIDDSRVRLVRVEGRAGKTEAQNAAVPLCKGEIVVFSDATTKYHPRALREIASCYKDPAVGAVGGVYRYFEANQASPTGLGAIFYSGYDNMVRRLQSRVWSMCGCPGCIYSVRRSLYTPLRRGICSDLVEPLQIIKKGYRVQLAGGAFAFEESTHSAPDEMRMRVRVINNGMFGLLSVKELHNPLRYPLAAFHLISYKWLRWGVTLMLPFLLLGSLLLSLTHGWARILTAGQVLFYLIALLALRVPLHRIKPLGIPLYFCTLNAAVLYAFGKVLSGRRFERWEPIRK